MTNHYDNIPSSSTQPGYKKTKLGWLPLEWEVNSMEDIVSRVQYSVDVAPEKIYREIGIRSHGKGLFYKNRIKGVDLGNKRVFQIRPGCLILNIVFAWEQAVAKTTEDEVGMIASHRFPMYKPRKGKSNVDYLLYFFKTPFGKHLLGLASPGGAGRNKTLGQKEFRKLQIPLPPLPEQQKIAAILSTWDRAIVLTRQLLQEKEAQKKGLMQRLLTGKVRVKGFEGAWDISELGQLFSLSSGKTKPQNTQSNSSENKNKPVYGGNGIMGYTDKSLLSGDKILIGRVGEYCGCVHVANGDYWVTDNCLFTKEFHHRISVKFLAYFLAFKQLKRFRNKGGQPLISQKSILKLKFLIPQIKEQTAIADILTQADEEIRLLREKEQALQAQKKGLMQRLLTGKIRVKS